MARISDALLRSRIPTALVLGAEPELLDRCQQAAVEVGVVVKGGPPSMAEALAEERRPLAIVVPEALYALEPSRYEALARAVASTLVRVHADVSAGELEEMMFRAVRTSVKQREWRAAPGRYAVVDEETAPSRVAPEPERRATPAPGSVRQDAPSPGSVRLDAPAPGSVRQDAPAPGSVRQDAPSPGSVRLDAPPPSDRTIRVPRPPQAVLDEAAASSRRAAPLAAALSEPTDLPAPSSRRAEPLAALAKTTDLPAPSSRRAPAYPLEIGRLFDERGMPRPDR